MRRRLSFALLMPLGCALASMWACGTDAAGIEACRKIEAARCAAYQRCGLLTDLNACERFYRDQCLGGVPGKVNPIVSLVSGCVSAIESDPTCNVAKAPEKASACAFLIPPVSAPPSTGVGGGAGAGGKASK